MKLKRIYIFIFSLILVSSLLFPIASSAATTSYSTSSNSGVRDEVCASISGTGVSEYYTGDYSIDSLISLDRATLLSKLRTLMTETHVNITSYSDCRDFADETACENGNGKIVTLYTSHTASYSDYKNGSGWNREHVWPKSLGGFDKDGAGADLHHIRPTENKTNSQRGNKKYGNVTSGTTSVGNLSSLSGGVFNGQYFEPSDNVKGDVARICLYVYVRWGGVYSQSNNILNVFESVDVLLEWCALDPVDTWEMGRNEVVEEIQGNRNVFIDYPELAWLLFGKEIPEDMTTPSGLAKEISAPTVCEHTSTIIKNDKSSTCLEKGYTGDTYCESCAELISRGESLPITSHSFGDEIILVEPTDSSAGYSKQVCTVCGYSALKELPMLEKKPGNDSNVYLIAGGATLVVILGGATLVVIKKRKTSK